MYDLELVIAHHQSITNAVYKRLESVSNSILKHFELKFYFHHNKSKSYSFIKIKTTLNKNAKAI